MVNYSATPAAVTKRVNRVLVVGTIESLKEQVAVSSASFLQQTISTASATSGNAVSFAAGAANSVLLAHAVATLSPSSDSGASSQVLLLRDANSEHAFHVTLFALPTLVSRANAPARPHAIHAFVKANRALLTKKTGDDAASNEDEVALVVLVLPNHQDTWFAAGAAVARSSHHYVHKASKSSGLLSENVDESVVVSGDNLAVVYQQAIAEKDLALIQHTADGIQLATRLTDAPPNELHSDTFIAEALRVAKRTTAAADPITRHFVLKLKKIHVRLLYVVAAVPTVMIHTQVRVALLNVQANISLPGLVVISLIEPLVRILKVWSSTAADHLLGRHAARTAVQGAASKAEGRLVLADGVAYAVKHLNPKVLIDMATLTGAQGIATGQKIASIYSNNEDLERLAVKAGKLSGDLVHPVPYAPEFFRSEYKSTVADMKNSVKNRTNAPVSCAGQFIGNHLGDYETSGKWLHIDMAFPVKTDDDERATGFGVALIQSLLKEIHQAGW